MYLFVHTDGTIQPAYDGFNPANPNWDELRDVKEVYYVAKTLVPQLKLVPKPIGASVVERAIVKTVPLPENVIEAKKRVRKQRTA